MAARDFTTVARHDQLRPTGAMRKPGHVRIGARVEITCNQPCKIICNQPCDWR